MKWHRLLLVLWVAVAASASEVTPVQKVVSLMKKMVEKGEAEMREEQETFAEYVKFCETTTVDKARAIEEASDSIDMLTADIEKAASDADALDEEIAKHSASNEGTSAEKDNATAIRNAEAEDYTDSIMAIGKAMAALKEKSAAKPQVALLQLAELHVNEKVSPKEASKLLDSFLEGLDEEEKKATPRQPAGSLLAKRGASLPAAAGYEPQSGGIVDLLEKLEYQFEQERNDLKVNELKKKNAFSTLLAGLDAELKEGASDRERKQRSKAAILEQKARDEAELADATASKEEDMKYKKDLERQWSMKAADYKSRQQLRQGELEALAKAISIISGDAVVGTEAKHVRPSMAATALAQLGTNLRNPSLNKVAHFLQEKADSLKSQDLAMLARQMDAASPLSKVIGIIEGLLAKKQELAASEATKQAWCEEELPANEATRKEKSEEKESLQADVEQINATIKQLGNDVHALSQQIAEINAAVAKAEEIRQKEKKENAVTVTDAKAGQAAVTQALGVLNDFYSQAAAAGPEVSFSGSSDSRGVIAMIEVIQSDFARLEAETIAEEESAAKEHEEFLKDSKLDVAGKEKDVKHKTARSEDLAQKLISKKEDLLDAEKGLDAALKTYEELKPQCADAQATYEERRAERAAEIESLKTALDALSA